MTTKKRVVANRLNAMKSSGPKTLEGKRAVRHNAVTHGLLSGEVVLSDESQEQYLEYEQALWSDLKPIGPLQEEEARKAVYHGWRLRRCAKIDNGTFENNLKRDQKSGVSTLALAFASGAVALTNLARYEGHAARLYIMARRELDRLQGACAAELNSPPPSDIEIGLTVDEQVGDAVQDFAASLEESEGPKRRRLRDLLLPNRREPNGEQPNGDPV
jgi:hypothetical protein